MNDMIENPYETRSDSFYFVNDRLIMHNKAAYKVFDCGFKIKYQKLRIKCEFFSVLPRGQRPGEEELRG